MSNVTAQYRYNNQDQQALYATELRARTTVKEAQALPVAGVDSALTQRVAYLERELKRVSDRLRLAEEEVVRLR